MTSSKIAHVPTRDVRLSEVQVDRELLVKQASLSIAIFIGFCFVFIINKWMPDRFGADSGAIGLVVEGVPNTLDASFVLPGEIYAFLGLNTSTKAGLANFFIYSLVFIWAVYRRLSTYSVFQVVLMAISLVLGAVFLGQYSKDVFVLVVVVAFLAARSSWKSEVVVVLSLGLYATIFRDYWWLILACYLTFRILTMHKITILRIVIIGLGILAVESVGFHYFLRIDLDHYRDQVNLARIQSDSVNTLISRIAPLGGMFGGWLNSVLIMFTLIVPIPLLLLGGIYYWAITAFILVLWILFFRRVQISQCNSQQTRLICLICSVLVTQSIFEPDFGSYLRHMTPLLPLFMITIQPTKAEVLHESSDRMMKSMHR